MGTAAPTSADAAPFYVAERYHQEYFARNPTVPKEAMVANVDLDMPILFYDFTDVVAFGSDRSGVGPAVRRAATRMGVALSPDPLPEN